MPREIITIQVGQCGIQLGSRFWDLALREHASAFQAQQQQWEVTSENRNGNGDSNRLGSRQTKTSGTNPGLFDEPMSSFFKNVDLHTGRDVVPHTSATARSLSWRDMPIQSLRARAILVDMEEGVINELRRSPLGELFDTTMTVSDVSGSGNNFAHGHYCYGDLYGDQIVDNVRRATEQCDSLQSFFLMHSLGGGTGSGLGTRITSLLEEHFPEAYRFSTVVFPSANDDVVTSPYNSILSMAHLIEHSNCVLPIDNEALIAICARIAQTQNKAHLTTLGRRDQRVSLLDISKAKRRAFDDMNTIGAHLLTNLTCGMRFGGELNVDLNEITMTLVPFPSMHFLLPSLSPLVTSNDRPDGTKNIDAMCLDSLHRDQQLIRVNPRQDVYLSCMLMARGEVHVTDLQRNISKLRREMEFAYWNTDGFKVGVCTVPALRQRHSLLNLSNNCCVTELFNRMNDKCRILYHVRAHLHHYEEYMDQANISEAIERVDRLIDDYSSVRTLQDHPKCLTQTAPKI